ncbi:unknown [Clostridium sp. CAG:492]|nr:unknown [Clostridium sp. CAG:492]
MLLLQMMLHIFLYLPHLLKFQSFLLLSSPLLEHFFLFPQLQHFASYLKPFLKFLLKLQFPFFVALCFLLHQFDYLQYLLQLVELHMFHHLLYLKLRLSSVLVLPQISVQKQLFQVPLDLLFPLPKIYFHLRLVNLYQFFLKIQIYLNMNNMFLLLIFDLNL